ncbi:MAG: RNB domain-containing ribonuclease [bacterium]
MASTFESTKNMGQAPAEPAQTSKPVSAAPSSASLIQPEQRELFDAVFALFKKSWQENLDRDAVEGQPHGKRLVRLVRATLQQRNLYPESWRVQFVRQLKTLHSLTGYRDVRTLLFDWLRRRELVPAQTDIFVYSSQHVRRHLLRLAQAEASGVPAITTIKKDDAGVVILTVDNTDTVDRDDALSLRRLSGGFEIGVHIPLLQDLVPKESTWDLWAKAMAVSVYMPHRHIPMLPVQVAEQAGLNAGTVRPVLSFYFSQEEDRTPQFERVCRESITITHNADYDQVSQWFAAAALQEKMVGKWKVKESRNRPSEYQTAVQVWWEGAQRLEQKRTRAGGRAFDREQVDIKVQVDGRVRIHRYSQAEPSHKMISEWMIAANHAAAHFCAKHHLPCLYRVQEAGSPRTEDEGPDSAPNFVRPQINLTMAPHRDLGIEGYTQVTSPLRRYTDLMMQRQMGSFLEKGSAVYSPQELQAYGVAAEEALRRIGKLEARAEFYYKCMYLHQNLGEELAAEICHSPPPWRSVVLMLPELNLRLFVPLSGIRGLGARQIPPADAPLPVTAVCLEIDPDRGTMSFEIKRKVHRTSGPRRRP